METEGKTVWGIEAKSAIGILFSLGIHCVFWRIQVQLTASARATRWSVTRVRSAELLYYLLWPLLKQQWPLARCQRRSSRAAASQEGAAYPKDALKTS